MKKSTVQSVNKERFTFVFGSLLGKKVIVKLKNLVSYEGVFSGSQMDKGDYTILLKFARELPSETRLSGPVIDQFVIPGKEILSLDGMDVAEDGFGDQKVVGSADFKTDSEINTRGVPLPSVRGAAPMERNLETWNPAEDARHDDISLDSHSGGWSGAQDQFAVARQMGVVSTYKEDLYTTPLDYSKLSTEQRAMAEKLAKEIEGGRNYASQEEGGADGDEEAAFSAVMGTGGYKGKQQPAAARVMPSDAAVSWRRTEDPSNGGANTRLNALNLEPAAARASGPRTTAVPSSGAAVSNVTTTPSSVAPLSQIPVRQTASSAAVSPHISSSAVPSMVSEMKGINALNLEPASVPKDAAGRLSARSSARTVSATSPQLTKRDFEMALAEIKSKEQRSSSGSKTPPTKAPPAPPAAPSGKFAFNPNAITFTPGGNSTPPTNPANSTTPPGSTPVPTAAAPNNTLNIVMTPGGSLAGSLKTSNYEYFEPGPMPMMPPPPMVMFPPGMGPPHFMPPMGMAAQPLPSPAFAPLVESAAKFNLKETMDRLADESRSVSSSTSTGWSATAAGTPSYKEILGPLPPSGSGMPPFPGPPMHHPGMHPMMVAAPFAPYGGYYGPPPHGRPPRGYPPYMYGGPPPRYRGGHPQGGGSREE